MKNSGKYRIVLAFLVLMLVLCTVGYLKKKTSLAGKFEVVYIPKARDDTNDFWTSLLEGAKMAAAEYDVELTILAPDSEEDFEAQIRYIDEAIAMKPDAIILSPTSMSEITEAADRIVAAGISLSLVDSELDEDIQALVVETDNRAAGNKMGEFILKNLPDDPVIGVVAHVESSSTAVERLEGLKEGLGKQADNIVGTVYCDSNYDKAYRLTEEMLGKHPELNVLVGLNEYSAVGAARAVKDMGMTDKILMVGFDSSIEEVHMLEEEVFKAIVIQKPFNMGYLGVENTVALLQGKKFSDRVDSGSELITKENMYTEENQKFLFPFWE